MKRSNIILLALNIAGAFNFFTMVQGVVSQAAMEERAMDGVDGITLFARTVPVLLAFALIGGAWVFKAIVDAVARQGWGTGKAAVCAAAVWLAAWLALRLLNG